MRLHGREAQRSSNEVGICNGHVSWHLCGGAQALGAGMGVANARLANQGDVSAPGKDRHGVDPYFESTSIIPKGGQSATSSCWGCSVTRFGDVPDYGSSAGTSTWSLRLLGSLPRQRDCLGSWWRPRFPPSDTGHQSGALTFFVVHRAVACQIREVRVLEESGISPHHPVCMRLKRSFQGLVTRVQAVPRSLPQPVMGCAREPWRWDIQREKEHGREMGVAYALHRV